MGKKFLCRDLGMDCPFEAQAETEEELMQKIAEHGRTAHGITEISPEMMEKVKQAIKDE
jgi:predicted small metal-binding protein